jgi:hypothetical protein
MTRTILALALLIFPISAFADSHKLGDSGIIVHDGPYIEPLPPETQDMTPAEFERWAIRENARASLEAKKQAALARMQRKDRTGIQLAHYTESSGSSRTQYGGGYGAGGVGGAGGYLGYGNQVSSGFGGIGRGFANFTGNNMQNTHQDTGRSYDMTWPDLDDNGGGPLLIINPYCPPSRYRNLSGRDTALQSQ